MLCSPTRTRIRHVSAGAAGPLPPLAASASSSGLISSASTTRPLSLSSMRPRTTTGPRRFSASPQIRYGSGKTVSGTEPSTRSSVANAIRLPLFVELSVDALI